MFRGLCRLEPGEAGTSIRTAYLSPSQAWIVGRLSDRRVNVGSVPPAALSARRSERVASGRGLTTDLKRAIDRNSTYVVYATCRASRTALVKPVSS